jgi:hypothetical protein
MLTKREQVDSTYASKELGDRTILHVPSPVLANLWHTAFTAVQIFISPAQPVSIYCEEYVYIYTYLTALRFYMNYRWYQMILQVKHCYMNQEQCKVLAGYLSMGCRPVGDWANM